MQDPLNIRLGTTSAEFQRAALEVYGDELGHILDSIRVACKEAHLEESRYVPEDLEREFGIVRWWLHQLDEDRLKWATTIGIQVSREYGAVMASAATVQREALKETYAERTQNPLTPVQALAALNDRIAAIQKEFDEIWSAFGVSPALARIRERRAVRRSGPGWQPLIRWLAEQPQGATRTWCVCDTTFFLESQALFDQVDWHRAWGFTTVVLVIPQAALRELDAWKGDPRRERGTRRKRAIKALGVVDLYAEAAPPGVPVELRPGVELLIIDQERMPTADMLDPSLPDDRIIDAALALRENLPSAQVVVISDDRGPRFKARRHGFECRDLGSRRRPLPKVD